MSRENFRKKEKGSGAPSVRFPKLLENLNKLYELCAFNDSAAARRLEVKPQQFNEWRKGEHSPTAAGRKHIASKLGISEKALLYEESGESIRASIEGRLGVSERYVEKFPTAERTRLVIEVKRIAMGGSENDRLITALLDVIDLAKESTKDRRELKQ